MPYKTRFIGPLLSGLFLLVLPPVSGGYWDFPPVPPAEEHGNVLINRTSEKNGVKPASFSHWTHRQKYTCRVCHSELEFNFRAGTTEITEADNRAGKYCGACHDGKTAFGHEKSSCEKCHNGNREYGKEKFAQLSKFPRTKFGNGVDWVRALADNLIKPANHLKVKDADDIKYDKQLTLEAEWANIPPAVFPHREHTQWLDCNNCHPDIFNIKKKATKHFSMTRILRGEFCGTCHLNVAFPMNDCKRCHPDMGQ